MAEPQPTPDPTKCASCGKVEGEDVTSLKQCAKCHRAKYCSRDCQKADWKTHKRVCGSGYVTSHIDMAQPSSNQNRTNTQRTPNRPPGGGQAGKSPKDSMYAMGVSSKDWLRRGNKSEDEVFSLLIDSYRMRVEDECNFRGQISGNYNGGDPIREFKKYLELAEAGQGILPRWWSPEKRDACVAKGSANSGWTNEGNLYSATEKSDIQEHYGDGQMPMKLRMLAEEITGSYIMDTSAKSLHELAGGADRFYE